ncbi:hypothetical protein CWE04_11525 [Thomasclavelia cocleata]|nr:hypothetical protein [Thomasclavelia cocleata]PJN79833.1 hypothetical protein CWE04_11525 [Thomasclavelia cocleata]
MKKDYITNFDNYVQYILEDNPDFNKDNEYFSIYTKIVNKFEMLVGKKISHFTPDELLECMENYNRGTKKTFRSF